MAKITIDAVTKPHYEGKRVVRGYSQWKVLFKPEEVIFDSLKEVIEGGDVLDIGCGGGRTTEYLGQRARRYTGIDYSDRMIEACGKQYTELDFIRADSSDMSIFDNDRFDFILFSFNGIDTMSHEKRIKTLEEVHRVLKPGGSFAFSSHNREDKNIVLAYDKFEKLGIVSLLRNVLHGLSYLKVRKAQLHTTEYAILSDPLAGFGQLTYYISRVSQVRQLQEAGFAEIQTLDWEGTFVETGESDETSHWFYYLSKKQA